MARGRMINSKITLNKAVNDLSDDTSRLAFTWLITFADVEGRTYGDPAVVRSMLFPRRTDISVEQMDGYIREWHEAGLIIWYEADDDLWIAFPKFDENQRGLDRRKEQESTIPAPESVVSSTYLVRTEHVQGTAEQNRSEVQQEQKIGASPETAAAPAPEAPPAKRPDRRSDPRSRHPAIQAARAATGARHYPPLEMYGPLLEALGERPDAPRLMQCRQEWIKRGFNPRAWTWAVEWYAGGIPDRTRGSPTTAPAPQADEERRRTAIEANRRRREEVQRARQQQS